MVLCSLMYYVTPSSRKHHNVKDGCDKNQQVVSEFIYDVKCIYEITGSMRNKIKVLICNHELLDNSIHSSYFLQFSMQSSFVVCCQLSFPLIVSLSLSDVTCRVERKKTLLKFVQSGSAFVSNSLGKR